MKDYNAMTDGQNFFDQPVRTNLITYDSIPKIVTGQRDEYATACLLDYPCFKEHYKLIATELSKQQAFDADRKAKQQISFTGSLDRAEGATMFFIIEEEMILF